MKTIRLFLAFAAASLAFPATAVAQKPAADAPKILLQTMRDNVDRISYSLEADRWHANVSLWDGRLGNGGKLDAATIGNMRDTLKTISTIIAQIRAADEKERWQANHDMWAAYLADVGMPTAATRASMMNLLKEMQANVAKITAPGEKERWSANCDLWKSQLATKQ